MSRLDGTTHLLVMMPDQHYPHPLGYYGASPLCGPRRMGLTSSRTPCRARVRNYHRLLSFGTPTRAHVPGAAGHETALLGRMHSCAPDERHGVKVR